MRVKGERHESCTRVVQERVELVERCVELMWARQKSPRLSSVSSGGGLEDEVERRANKKRGNNASITFREEFESTEHTRDADMALRRRHNADETLSRSLDARHSVDTSWGRKTRR